MQPMSYARHRFPPVVIRYAVWLYLRFTLSYRDVEDLLAERGLEVSNETIRRWVLKFGPAIARNLTFEHTVRRPVAVGEGLDVDDHLRQRANRRSARRAETDQAPARGHP